MPKAAADFYNNSYHAYSQRVACAIKIQLLANPALLHDFRRNNVWQKRTGMNGIATDVKGNPSDQHFREIQRTRNIQCPSSLAPCSIPPPSEHYRVASLSLVWSKEYSGTNPCVKELKM